jgi:hypothetical protein
MIIRKTGLSSTARIISIKRNANISKRLKNEKYAEGAVKQVK